jgi:hypothetical protein
MRIFEENAILENSPDDETAHGLALRRHYLTHLADGIIEFKHGSWRIRIRVYDYENHGVGPHFVVNSHLDRQSKSMPINVRSPTR